MGDEVCATLSFQDYYTIKFGSRPKDLDEYLLKSIVGGVEKDKHEVQVDGEIDMESTVHDEDVHEEVALELSCESSVTNTSDRQIVDNLCGELELVHSSSPTAGIEIVMIGEIHEVQGNEHNSQDMEQSHMEVRESLYMHEIEIPDDSHRKKIQRVK